MKSSKEIHKLHFPLKEFELLLLLMRNAGQVLTRESS